MDRCSEVKVLAVNMWGGVFDSFIFKTWVYYSFTHIRLYTAMIHLSLGIPFQLLEKSRILTSVLTIITSQRRQDASDNSTFD